MRTLNVKAITVLKLAGKWGIGWTTIILKKPIKASYNTVVYVRCNAKGIVNWDKTTMYEAHELIERNNVNIIKE